MQQLISVREGDALKLSCDVLALKYAQDLYGVDKAVFLQLYGNIPSRNLVLPRDGDHLWKEGAGKIAARDILFVGTVPLYHLSYGHIKEFTKKVLSVCAVEKPQAKSIAITLHGVNSGLDEKEALYSEIVGISEAISEGLYPNTLESIIIIEYHADRAERLRNNLEHITQESNNMPLSHILLAPSAPGGNKLNRNTIASGVLVSPKLNRTPGAKPSIFVAMPFAAEMDDVFYYGIQKPIEALNHLCERADLTAFTGDVIQWVKQRISSAELVVADLTSANPNVYLEVGFAWGIGKSTVLLARKDSELKFDVRGQRCLLYSSIKDLEDRLRNELQVLLI